MRLLPSSTILPLTLLLACGCTATPGRYPSLAPRPIEKIDVGIAPPVRPAAALPVDPALEARTAELLRAARRAAADFDQALAVATRAAARAGAAGSESWIDAQQQLTVVQRARTAMVTAVAELDAVRLAQAQAGTANTASLDAAWAEVSALDETQAGQLDALGRRLATP